MQLKAVDKSEEKNTQSESILSCLKNEVRWQKIQPTAYIHSNSYYESSKSNNTSHRNEFKGSFRLGKMAAVCGNSTKHISRHHGVKKRWK